MTRTAMVVAGPPGLLQETRTGDGSGAHAGSEGARVPSLAGDARRVRGGPLAGTDGCTRRRGRLPLN
jgi:hypothetical protein